MNLPNPRLDVPSEFDSDYPKDRLYQLKVTLAAAAKIRLGAGQRGRQGRPYAIRPLAWPHDAHHRRSTQWFRVPPASLRSFGHLRLAPCRAHGLRRVPRRGPLLRQLGSFDLRPPFVALQLTPSISRLSRDVLASCISPSKRDWTSIAIGWDPSALAMGRTGRIRAGTRRIDRIHRATR
ncbi:hypothetical protein PYCCODRAFT_191138 [Trametes coccinea BRFM310]|uniref:Uncharacterized protein n=1 Tax=Trametes coccinea (strain BRFM310) TaxID=1353009 RepID=A0A1Y2ISX2_TRAC3|nr:hypothetical protein PYCCODRAFT_191138 [Trametes coccinea BRFM310]